MVNAHVVQALWMAHLSGDLETLHGHLRILSHTKAELVAQAKIERGARVMVAGAQLEVGGGNVIVLLLHVLNAQLELDVADHFQEILNSMCDRRLRNGECLLGL